jgi:hypothetical protein
MLQNLPGRAERLQERSIHLTAHKYHPFIIGRRRGQKPRKVPLSPLSPTGEHKPLETVGDVMGALMALEHTSQSKKLALAYVFYLMEQHAR